MASITAGKMKSLLTDFKKAVEKKEYTVKIPYEIWKIINHNTKNIRYEHFYPKIKFFIDESLIYSASIEENGFGHFFYKKMIIENEGRKEEMANDSYVDWGAVSNVSNASNATTITTDTYTYTTGEVAVIANEKAIDDLKTQVSIIKESLGSIQFDIERIIDELSMKINYFDVKGIVEEGLSDITYELDHKVEYGEMKDIVQEVINKIVERKTEEAKLSPVYCEENKESKIMKGINFDFGPCGDDIRLSMYGIALKNAANEWVSYDSKTAEIINVDIFNIAECSKYIYKIPTAIKDIKRGDVIIHNKVPVFVTFNNIKNGVIEVVDITGGETRTIMPTRNVFNFNFVIKVVNLFDSFMSAPSADQPFGNMLPFLMMGENKDIDPVMMFFMMGQGGTNVMANPMMMYFMMKDNKDFDPMMLMFMMNQTQPHTCNCGKHVEKSVTQA